MPTFDPARPHDGSTIEADELRDQFNGLKTLIDAGIPGPKGDRGGGIQSIQDTGGAVLITTDDNSGWGPFPLPPGQQGQRGEKGDTGDVGPQGLPGDVSTQQMNDAIGSAIADTSNNSNSVQLLNLTVSDPPTQSEMQSIANKMDELIGALRR